MFPVLGRKIIECQQHVAIFFQAADSLVMVETVFKTIKSELIWRTSYQLRRPAENAIATDCETACARFIAIEQPSKRAQFVPACAHIALTIACMSTPLRCVDLRNLT
jgi:hypothetical protein